MSQGAWYLTGTLKDTELTSSCHLHFFFTAHFLLYQFLPGFCLTHCAQILSPACYGAHSVAVYQSSFFLTVFSVMKLWSTQPCDAVLHQFSPRSILLLLHLPSLSPPGMDCSPSLCCPSFPLPLHSPPHLAGDVDTAAVALPSCWAPTPCFRSWWGGVISTWTSCHYLSMFIL